MPGSPTLPALRGFNESSSGGNAPLVYEYVKDPASANVIRVGDPVVLASGLLQRATPSSTTLLGFSLDAEQPGNYVTRDIPIFPGALDSAGRTKMRVAVASPENVFVARLGLALATSLANLGTAYDLAFQLVSPTPTVTPVGTTGATTYTYKIVSYTAVGSAPGGTSGASTTSNAALSSTNLNRITWTPPAGAVYNEVWKDVGGSVFRFLARVDGTVGTYDDTGAVTPVAGSTIPSVNDAGVHINTGATSTALIQIQRIIENPREPVGTLGGLVAFQIPNAKSQFIS